MAECSTHHLIILFHREDGRRVKLLAAIPGITVMGIAAVAAHAMQAGIASRLKLRHVHAAAEAARRERAQHEARKTTGPVVR